MIQNVLIGAITGALILAALGLGQTLRIYSDAYARWEKTRLGKPSLNATVIVIASVYRAMIGSLLGGVAGFIITKL